MSVTLDTTLLGPVDCSVSQIVAAVKWSSTATAYDEATVQKIAASIAEWSGVFGYLTSPLAAQILHETGRFRYGGQVKPDQWNFAGLGSTNDGAVGAKFAGISDGVLAVCCHRALYQFGDVAQWPQHLQQYGPKAIRRDAVKSAGYLGTVQTIGDFTNGKWAWSPQYPKGSLDNGYASAIARGANEILAYPDNDKPKELPTLSDIPGVPFVAADSRHYTKSRSVQWPDLLINHHTDGSDSLNWLTKSPSSDVSATYLLNHDGTMRAQLVSHADTPHTTGNMNPRSISFEWERRWPEQSDISNAQYRNIAQSWANVVTAERRRGNPNFQGAPKRTWMGAHKDYYNTTCPGNLDVNRVYTEMTAALGGAVRTDDPVNNPNAKQFTTGHSIVNVSHNGLQVRMLDFYEREGGIIQLGMPLEGMHLDEDGVFRQGCENVILEFWSNGFGNQSGEVYRFGRYLDHVDRIREQLAKVS